ncbi:MAG TPA: GlxA family transcriptional regulator, partial [Steroidobacteraceae bacterium]|jgi:transcriptional regulator GlxA family with amidase domain|nr:GlxA family transcriptional regulator [Steroidobacteraceae bacterium]
MHRIGFVIFQGANILCTAPVSVFEMANQALGKSFYDVRILSDGGGPVRTSVGITIETEAFGEPDFDTLLIGAGTEIEPATPKLLEFIAKGLGVSRRIAAPCTGAFMLAEAGILDGRRVTTHWAFARELQTRYPKVKVEEDRIFIVDGSVWTSAGMTAGIDLALAMVEKDLGTEIARAVAKKMVVYHRRAGGQSQFSMLLELEPKSDRIQSALSYARRHLQTTLSVEQLAEVANLSPRQFSRAFRAETGQSPAKAVENLRVEAARLLMEQGQLPIDIVARETGFADRERMRRAFLRAFGQPPQAIRRAARVAA